MNQKDIVYNIVKEAGGFGIRTEQVKRLAMFKGVSCPDRYCRYWQKDAKIKGKYENNNKTKTWRICEPKPKQQNFLNPVHQKIIDNITLKPLTKKFMEANSQDIKDILG